MKMLVFTEGTIFSHRDWPALSREEIAYLLLQMRLEGKGLAGEHTIRQVQAIPGEQLPFVLLAQLASQELVVYYDESMPTDLRNELAATVIEFPKVDSLLDVFRSHGIHPEVGHYRTYVFRSPPAKDTEVRRLSKHDPRVQAFGFGGFVEWVYAVERNDALASACASTRENEECGEAWVYTDPAYRHQGFAQKVVNTWADSLVDAGKIPFYSHKIENAASASLARKLGLQPVFDEISIENRLKGNTGLNLTI